MAPAIVIGAIIIIIIGAAIHTRWQSKRRLNVHIRTAFGATPNAGDMEMESIRRYAKGMENGDRRVDSTTWNDLDMDRVFMKINACLSSVGEEYLYDTLHVLEFSPAKLHEREALIKFFAENEKERFEAQLAIAGLGKQNHNGVSSLIHSRGAGLLPRPMLYKALACLPFVAISGVIVNLYVGMAALIVSFFVNMYVHYKVIRTVDAEIPTINYFGRMLKCCSRMYSIPQLAEMPVMRGLRGSFALFKKIISKAPVGSGGMGDELLNALWTYISITFLVDIRNYNRFLSSINKHSDDFHAIYKAIGEIDMAQAVSSFRAGLPAFCTPEFHTENTLEAIEIFHPLLSKPVTNCHTFTRNALVTGSNASGKSTFIKALAINGILAQTINTCAAARFATRFSLIISSMAVRDDLLGGDSYFIVETKSLKRILDILDRLPCTIYIDEILRGTNTTERIAASVAILEHISARDCLCIVASHDIELTRMLDMDNLHFREQVTERGVEFDYILKHSPSSTRNAIALLNHMGFDEGIVKRAEDLAA